MKIKKTMAKAGLYKKILHHLVYTTLQHLYQPIVPPTTTSDHQHNICTPTTTTPTTLTPTSVPPTTTSVPP